MRRDPSQQLQPPAPRRIWSGCPPHRIDHCAPGRPATAGHPAYSRQCLEHAMFQQPQATRSRRSQLSRRPRPISDRCPQSRWHGSSLLADLVGAASSVLGAGRSLAGQPGRIPEKPFSLQKSPCRTTKMVRAFMNHGAVGRAHVRCTQFSCRTSRVDVLRINVFRRDSRVTKVLAEVAGG